MPRLTYAPLPEWGGLIKGLTGVAAPDDVLSRPWCRDGDASFWYSRSAWSLSAIAGCRQRLSGNDVVTVWVPDFFCNASLAPLRSMGARLVLYPVTADLLPDFDALDALTREHGPDLFLLVHYFGRPAVADAIVAFCRQQGAWLVEDAAHLLRPSDGIGESGDCVLYSPHKHLPIPDGALQVVRADGPARLAEQADVLRTMREMHEELVASSATSCRVAYVWLIKRLLQRLGLRARDPEVASGVEAEAGDACLASPGISALAKRLLTPLTGKLDKVARLRKRHAQDWKEILLPCDLLDTVKASLVTWTPYLACFTGERESDAQQLFERLRCAGFPVTTWPDLPPEVVACPAEHQAAWALRHNRIYLPVHQSLEWQEMRKCGERLLVAETERWKARELGPDEWDDYWQQCSGVNLLQSSQYGLAKDGVDGLKPRRLLISDAAGEPVAMMQLLTRVLPFIGGAVRLNRGPLLLADVPRDRALPLKLSALQVLLREARRRRWWLLQAAPELPLDDAASAGMQTLGFKKLPARSWGSARLLLDDDEDSLLMGLKGKWRNCLRKGEKLGVTVAHHVCTGVYLELLVRSYNRLQHLRGFEGLSENIIRALSVQQGAGGSLTCSLP